MEIIINDGRKDVLIRGTEMAYDLCEMRTRGELKTWEAVRWYVNLPSLFDYLLNSLIRCSNARTLNELKTVIETVRLKMLSEYRDAIEVT